MIVDTIKPIELHIRVVEPANSISGAKGMLVISGASANTLSGSTLWVHNGTIFIPVGGKVY